MEPASAAPWNRHLGSRGLPTFLPPTSSGKIHTRSRCAGNPGQTSRLRPFVTALCLTSWMSASENSICYQKIYAFKWTCTEVEAGVPSHFPLFTGVLQQQPAAVTQLVGGYVVTALSCSFFSPQGRCYCVLKKNNKRYQFSEPSQLHQMNKWVGREVCCPLWSHRLPREAVAAPPWQCSRPGWTGLWETWSDGRCPCSWHGVGTGWSIRSLPTQTILWF